MIVTIPPVRAFARVEPDKAQALKPLEEAAEVFAAWQAWDYWRARDVEERYPDIDLASTLEIYRKPIVDECADVIQATCNLLSALGVTDLTDAMAACERRNRERGRYGGEAAPKCSEPTPKCDTSATHTDATATHTDTSATRDRDALLALADEMSDHTWYETEGDHRIAEGFADRIRVALGAAGGGRRVFVGRLVTAVDSRCGAGASRLRGQGPRATGGRRP